MMLSHKKIVIVFLVGTALTVLATCTPTPSEQKENALARVGTKYLTVDEAQKSVPPFLLKQDSIGALKKYRDQWIKQQVLLQEAKRLGLPQKKAVQQQLKQAEEEILREALRKTITASKEKALTITDEEARTYYQAHKNQFALDEEFVQFRHMRARTLKEARAAKQDLLGGVSWEEVAHDYAINPESALEKAEQYWPISMALSDISIMNRYLNIIGQSEISPIQRVNGVYHFVQLIDSRAKGELPDLDWLLDKIKDWMLLNKQRRNFSSYLKNLYLKAKSNNEVETFNVLPTQTNPTTTFEDTLESNSTDE
ncbi:peptidyl-prolyl cis-trans isomerase [Fodinibius saliphilus]|uniref:peptidyl-prolyl cis-trans isomerase n=1 Tax=Fodinibius saliphilus TaxID=1920650 RepID=UPI001109D640|nr:peptidyl-prolyl cis-trans isomerase [Fodinibius saliphilus]